jgi:hypothetical protein
MSLEKKTKLFINEKIQQIEFFGTSPNFRNYYSTKHKCESYKCFSEAMHRYIQKYISIEIINEFKKNVTTDCCDELEQLTKTDGNVIDKISIILKNIFDILPEYIIKYSLNFLYKKITRENIKEFVRYIINEYIKIDKNREEYFKKQIPVENIYFILNSAYNEKCCSELETLKAKKSKTKKSRPTKGVQFHDSFENPLTLVKEYDRQCYTQEELEEYRKVENRDEGVLNEMIENECKEMIKTPHRRGGRRNKKSSKTKKRV